MAIKLLPLEILIMIIEMLRLQEASRLCEALNISQEFSYQYHKFDAREYSWLRSKIYDYHKRKKILNPNFAKALFKNVKFQSLAQANDKVTIAILSQDLDLVRNALQDPRVDHDDIDYSPLQIASRCGQLDIVKLLVNDYGINISTSDDEGFKNACEEWHIDIIQYFLSHPDFNPEYCSGVFVWALGNVDVFRLLLEDKRLDPSFNNNQALRAAAERGNLEIVKLLLADPRVNLSEPECERIFDLTCTGPMQRIRPLLAKRKQNTPAIIKHSENVLEIVKLLLKHS